MTPNQLLRGFAVAVGCAAGAAFGSEPLPEPVGIPMRTINTPMPGVSPFSARYHAAYYQAQIDMRNYQAWAAQQAAVRAAWLEARGTAGADLAMARTSARTGQSAALAKPVMMDAPEHLKDVPSGTIIKREVISEKVYRANPDGTKTLVSSADFPAGKAFDMPSTATAVVAKPAVPASSRKVVVAKRKPADLAAPTIVKVSATEPAPPLALPEASAEGVKPAK